MEVLFDLIWLFSFSSSSSSFFFFFFTNYKVTCVELDKKMHTEKRKLGRRESSRYSVHGKSESSISLGKCKWRPLFSIMYKLQGYLFSEYL